MPEATLRLSDQVVFRPLSGGGGVLLHLETGAYHSVNGSGATICRLLDGTRTLGQVQDELARDHADEAEEVRREVADYVSSLQTRGLLSTG